jgi:hypothetical protein
MDARLSTTVVIPAWDAYAGPRLSTALASIRDQDRTSRIVVVDNASVAALPDLPGAEVVKSARRLTLGAARNMGLEGVQTQNVIFWDADDVMPPGTLAFLEDELERNPGLVAFGAAIVEDPSGRRHRWPRRWLSQAVRHPMLLATINAVWSTFPTTGATIMRTAAVRACGGYADADSGEDWCLGAALLFRGRVGWSERPGRLYLQHAGSSWSTYGGPANQLRHAAAVRRRLAEDPSLPVFARALLPLLGPAQRAAVASHLMAVALRRAAGRPAALSRRMRARA